MNSIEEAKQKLRSLIPKSTFEKMVYVTAILTKLLEHNRIRPVIVFVSVLLLTHIKVGHFVMELPIFLLEKELRYILAIVTM
jgi:hypothetical protein